MDSLIERQIQMVVQLAVEESPLVLPRDIATCRFPLIDGQGNRFDLLVLAIRTVRSLVEQETPSLVCCGAGMSRSPAITACAIAQLEGVEAALVLRRISLARACDVSLGLWRDLQTIR